MRAKNSSGQKIRFFLVRTTRRGKLLTFFLANNSRQGILMIFSSPWQGICAFRRGIYYGDNLSIVARIGTWWRDATGTGKEKFGVILAGVFWRWKFLIFFLAGSCTPQALPNRRGLVIVSNCLASIVIYQELPTRGTLIDLKAAEGTKGCWSWSCWPASVGYFFNVKIGYFSASSLLRSFSYSFHVHSL